MILHCLTVHFRQYFFYKKPKAILCCINFPILYLIEIIIELLLSEIIPFCDDENDYHILWQWKCAKMIQISSHFAAAVVCAMRVVARHQICVCTLDAATMLYCVYVLDVIPSRYSWSEMVIKLLNLAKRVIVVSGQPCAIEKAWFCMLNLH